MATANLKRAPRNGLPKTSRDTPMYSDAEGNTNDIPTFFTTKHYKWLLKYQQLFQFYGVHGDTNVTRANADNSLAEWASYQTYKLVTVDNYDLKWKQLLNGIGVCCSPSSTPDQVFENYLASYNALRGTRNAITPKKADAKALRGWWKYWRQKGYKICLGSPEKSKIKIGRKYLFYILQAYLVVFPLKS
jgi:hypothetical protein